MTIYLDTETTGLSPPRDEILEIGILDDQGRVLVDSLVRSVNHSMWTERRQSMVFHLQMFPMR